MPLSPFLLFSYFALTDAMAGLPAVSRTHQWTYWYSRTHHPLSRQSASICTASTVLRMTD